MRQIVLSVINVFFVVSFFPSFAQIVKRDVIWSEDYSSITDIDPDRFPDLKQKYDAQVAGTNSKYILLRLPNGFSGSYDFQLKLNYSGTVQYDSIKVESYVSMLVYDLKINNECRFRSNKYNGQYLPGPPIEYTGMTSFGYKVWGGGTQLLCKDCKEVDFRGSLSQWVGIEYEKWNMYAIQRDNEVDCNYMPYNFNNTRPVFDFGKAPYQEEEYRKHFCNLCANDIDRLTRDEDLYFQCMSTAIIPTRSDVEVRSSIAELVVYGFRHESPLGVEEEEKESTASTLLKLIDLNGVEIPFSQAEGKMVIAHYSNGQKRLLLYSASKSYN